MRKLNTKQFIFKANQIHNNKYNYSLVEYIGTKTKVNIICHQHGKFKQTPYSHLSGSGCPNCGNIIIGQKLRSSLIKFINKSNIIHNNKYDYSKVIYNRAIDNVIIVCPIHKEFLQKPSKHLTGHGCPKCNSSKGELLIEQYLKEHNINYKTQKRFHNCRNKLPLPFDFYLPDHNICIEFDGELHFKSSNYFGGHNKLLQTQHNDKIKNDYCNGINSRTKLIRIPYWKKQYIQKILSVYI
jgi:ssDNA-binding Zn-finger/Zn-ribbon topoisomerase 1